MSDLILHPNAKINVHLKVLGKHNDGLHEIQSVFIPISLCDELHLAAAHSLEFEMISPLNCPPKDNLVYKAAIALQNFIGRQYGAKIQLRKQIPVGAGLGGGSSDAAFTLLGLNSMWNCALSIEDLHSIAVKLGSDVPFFLYNASARVCGRGERISPIDFTLSGVVLLVVPSLYISTAWAYQALQRPFLSDVVLEIPNNMSDFCNDFEEKIFSVYPRIAEIHQQILNAGADFARLSGSGSAVFGIFNDVKAAKFAQKQFSDCQTWITQQLPHIAQYEKVKLL